MTSAPHPATAPPADAAASWHSPGPPGSQPLHPGRCIALGQDNSVFGFIGAKKIVGFAQEIIVKQMEDYFFGEGAQLPAGYVPPKTKQ